MAAVLVAKIGSGSHLVTATKRAGSTPFGPHGTAITLATEHHEDFMICEDLLR
jgi:hypothetical protein